jgi:hypothetical protein
MPRGGTPKDEKWRSSPWTRRGRRQPAAAVGVVEAVETQLSRDLQPPPLGRVAQQPVLIEEGIYFRRKVKRTHAAVAARHMRSSAEERSPFSPSILQRTNWTEKPWGNYLARTIDSDIRFASAASSRSPCSP